MAAALLLADTVLCASDDHSGALLIAGVCLLCSFHTRALEVLHKATILRPTHHIIRREFARALFVSQQYVAALQQIQRGLQFGKDKSSLLLLAQTLIALDRRDQAIGVLQDCIQWPQSHPTAHVLLAKCLKQANEFERCEQVLIEACEQYSHHAAVRMEYGRMLFDLRNRQMEAIQLMEQACQCKYVLYNCC